jgi:hypothetical protein
MGLGLGWALDAGPIYGLYGALSITIVLVPSLSSDILLHTRWARAPRLMINRVVGLTSPIYGHIVYRVIYLWILYKVRIDQIWRWRLLSFC